MRTPEEQLVDASLEIGKALLLAGGEVTRVEDTITRILHAYGMREIGVFTITSLIEVTACTPDGDEQRLDKAEQAGNALAEQHIAHRVGDRDARYGQHDAADEDFIEVDTYAHADEHAAEKAGQHRAEQIEQQLICLLVKASAVHPADEAGQYGGGGDISR